jgi:copper chaperone CopZ
MFKLKPTVMKIAKSLLIFAFSVLLFVSCKEKVEETTMATTENTEEIPVQLATASFTVEGMHCEFGCAKGIEKKLAKLEGVQEVSVDFEGQKATISYDANKQTPEVFVQTVENMSDEYKVSDVKNSADKAFLSDKN